MRLFLSISFVLLGCIACENKSTTQTSVAQEAPLSSAEPASHKSPQETIVENVKELLSEEEAKSLYTKACNDNIERIATECDCLANFFQENLPYLMFALEASSEAGHSDLSASIINTMDDIKLDFRKTMGETRMRAWDTCLTEGVEVP